MPIIAIPAARAGIAAGIGCVSAGIAWLLLRLIGEEPLGIDSIIERSGMAVGRASALLVTAWKAVTGGIHLDGLADTVEASALVDLDPLLFNGKEGW